MTLMDLIMKRKSVRRYTDEEVPDEDIKYCLEAARWAPSGTNKQSWHFIIIRNKETQEKLVKLMPWAKYNKFAPVAIACLANKKSVWHLIDVSIATEHLVLAAAERGLGTCWSAVYGIKKPEDYQNQIMNILGVPEELQEKYVVVTITPLGHPAEGGITKTKRKNLEKIYSLEKFELE